MRFMTDCRVEDAESKSGERRARNPDFIGKWRGKSWGIACKALHSVHPETTISHITKGIDQIKKSGVDVGIVLLNAKNLIPEDAAWPGQKDGDEWEYAAYPGVEVFCRQIDDQQVEHILNVLARASGEDFERTEDGRFNAAGRGRHVLLKKFQNSNVHPWMTMIWLSVIGQQTQEAGVVAPSIFRLVTTFALPDGAMDDEVTDFQILLSLAIQNVAPTEENLAIRKASGDAVRSSVDE